MAEIAVPKYDMNHEKRGIALLINIRSYDAPNQRIERNWSEKDLENLKETLKYLEFDIRSYENLKAKQIKDEIQKLAKLDHTNSDCFLCVVMSHGNDEKIMTSDNQEISFKEIMKPIKEECPTLIGKPKLFFFQACRGENEMMNRQDSGESTSSGHTETDDVSNISTIASSHSSDPKIIKRTFFKFEADLLVYYATKKHYSAFATEKNKGTIFIESVCEVFNQAYMGLPKNLSLSQMITIINAKVGEKGGIQLTDPRPYFNKEVYFTPKNVSLKLHKKIINWILAFAYQRKNF
jgi:hypothetical protein